MNPNTTLILLMVFVALTAVSFAAQAVAMLRLAKTAKEIKDRVDAFLPKAEQLIKTAETIIPTAQNLIHTAESIIADSRTQIAEITGRANDILVLTQTQLVRVDDLVADASEPPPGEPLFVKLVDRGRIVYRESFPEQAARADRTWDRYIRWELSPKVQSVMDQYGKMRATEVAAARGRQPS